VTDSDAMVAPLLALANGRLAALPTPWTAYSAGKAPTTGGNYLALIVSRRYGGNIRQGGSISPSGWRFTARAVGVGDGNARVLLREATAAFEDHTITVDGVTSTPIAFESEDPIRQDDDDKNLWSGLRSFTYAF
jgi:hypothetical protein